MLLEHKLSIPSAVPQLGFNREPVTETKSLTNGAATNGVATNGVATNGVTTNGADTNGATNGEPTAKKAKVVASEFTNGSVKLVS